MNRTARQQAAAKAATMTTRLSDEALAQAWMITEVAPLLAGANAYQALIRGWMMEEIQTRLGDDLFDEWLMDETADGSTADPITYLIRAKG